MMLLSMWFGTDSQDWFEEIPVTDAPECYKLNSVGNSILISEDQNTENNKDDKRLRRFHLRTMIP